MVHDVREESIEHLEGGVDLHVNVRVDKHKDKVEEILPYLLLHFVHCAGNFDDQVTDLVDDNFILACINGLQ